MDVTAYFTALGLSTAAGLNAWLPLLATGLLARWTDLIDLDGGWDALASWPVIGGLAAIAVVDFIGDKVPAVDSLLHAAGTVIAPAAGVVASLAATGDADVSSSVVAVIGLLAAGTAHGTRMAARPVSTVGTAGAGNPVLSLGEDVVSGVLSLAAIALPVVALILAVAVLAGAVWTLRRLKHARDRLGGRPARRGSP